MSLEIRTATPADEAGWRALWQGFCAGYDMALPEAVTAHTWARLMDPVCPLVAGLAVEGDRILGFALHQHHPSTWVLGDDGYLEDLYVAPEARGKGAGAALIEDLIGITALFVGLFAILSF